MTQLARLGFVLLGLDTILSSASILVANFSQFVMQEYAVGIIVSVSWAVFALVPGAFLIMKSRTLAEYLFGPSESETAALDTYAFLTAGLAILGVWLVLTGVGILAGAGIKVLMTPPNRSLDLYAVRDAAQAVLYMIFGSFLALRARMASRILLGSAGKPAA